MANGINNKYEYRSGLLDSLNVQHTASDVRNEDEYRKRVLNGLGVEYTEDDINQKNLYRAKVVEGLASSGGGGGESDFSTAEVTVVVDNPETFTGEVGMWLASSFNTTDEVLYITADAGIFVENNKAKVLMCGNAILNGLLATDDNHDYTGSIISATGNISKNGRGALARWVVIGDGTITVHFSAIMPQP